jgi:eukaryotic-like serine/threonine-protein kinase
MDENRELFINEGYMLEELLAGDTWGELHRAVYVPHRREVLFRRFVQAIGEAAPWELAAAEIQAWARVDHPGVLQPLDWGNPQSGPFLATDLPEGVPLGVFVEGRDASEALDPITVFAQIISAVESARVLGVLHLGLGLTNIWVSPAGSVKLSEFGLWYLDREYPALLALDDAFFAPEQSTAGHATAAADVYALGLILLALFGGTGAAAVAAGGDLSVLMSIELPDGVREVVPRCLAADPFARPRAAGELGAALGLAPSEEAFTFRDCPVCRLKEEIAREKGAGSATVSERLRALAGGAPGAPVQDEGQRRPAPVIDPIIPWIAIAALVLATLVVWWLAFR